MCTPGVAAQAARARSTSGAVCSHTHRVAALASTTSGRSAPVARSSAARSSADRSASGSSLQMTAAVWVGVSA